jgi:aminobenzoyl-glutamate utilization protein B
LTPDLKGSSIDSILSTVYTLPMTGLDPALSARRFWTEIEPEIRQKFAELWHQPELGNMEFGAASALAGWLEGYGFAVERGVCGLPTAFRARTGAGLPRVGILAEYDALPGTDNAAVPARQRTGKRAGHACGHNQIGPANCGAAIAAASAARQIGLAGEIVVLGTPAEEIIWGKVALLKLGAFEGIEALLTSHGDYQNGAISRPCQSVVSGEVVYLGESGHGGSTRRSNALDGAELAVQSIERLRAHYFPDVSVEHVLRRGGDIPNVTPAEARLWLTTRHQEFARAREVYDFAVGVGRQAAELTGLAFRHQFIAATRGYLPSDALARHLHAALRIVGPPKWTPDGLEFMRQLVRACRPNGAFVLDDGIGYYDQGLDPYGQDDGEASWRIPLGRINWAFPEQVPLHNWALTALAGNAAGHPGPLMASEALAIATVGLLADPSTIEKAKAELQERTRGITLGQPEIGALQTMRLDPAAFWDATWVE